MKQIPLTQGCSAIVDDEDYDWLMQWKWYVKRHRYTYYAARACTVDDKRKTKAVIKMHTEILKKHKLCSGALQIDHKNRNGLDNQKNNLRQCGQSGNMRNAIGSQKASSKYKGVSWNKALQRWAAIITPFDKNIYLGSFDNEIYAAKVYDLYARKYFKEYAYLNFPDEEPIKEPKVRRIGKKHYIGVEKRGNKYTSRIMCDGEKCYLGIFNTAIEAAMAYDEKAKKSKRKFNFFNFQSDAGR